MANGKGGGAGPTADQLKIAQQMYAMLEQMKSSADKISRSFETQAEATAQMAENMKDMGTGGVVAQLVEVNKTLKDVAASLANLKTISIDTFKEVSEGSAAAAVSSQEFSLAATRAGEAVAASTSKFKDMSKNVLDTDKKTVSLRQKLQEVSDHLKGKFPTAAAAAAGALSGLQQSFSNLMAIGSGIFGFLSSLVSSIFEIGKSILSIPFKVFGGLIDMANSGGGGVSELAEAINGLRKEFGALSGPTNTAIMGLSKSMGQLSVAGISATKIFGNVADRINLLKDLFLQGGAAVRSFTGEIARSGGLILAYQKGLGLSNEEMGTMASYAKRDGKTMKSVLNDITKQSMAMGKAFGLDAKIISKEMAKAAADMANFGHMSQKQLGVAVTYAQKLGFELSGVAGTMDKFSLFEDAAENVSTLNTAFGTNIDMNEMMNAQDPTERAEIIRKAMLDQGLTVDKLSYLQRKLFKETSGMDDAAMNATLSSDNMATSLEDIKKVGEKAEATVMSDAQAMGKLADAMDRVFKSGGERPKSFWEAFMTGMEKGFKSIPAVQRMFQNIRNSTDQFMIAGMKFAKLIYENFPGIQKIVEAFTELFDPTRIGELLNSIHDRFAKFIGDLKSGKSSFKELMKGLKEDFFDYFKKSGPGADKLLSGFDEFFGAIKTIFAGAIEWIMTSLGELINDIVSFLKNPPSLDIAGAAGVGQKALSPIAEAFRNGWKVLGPALSDLFDVLMDKLIPIVQKKITEFTKEHFGKILLYLLGPAILKSFIAAGSVKLSGAVVGMISRALGGASVAAAATTGGAAVTTAMTGGVTIAVSTAATTAETASTGFFSTINSSFSKGSATLAEKIGPKMTSVFKFAGVAAIVATAAINISESMEKFEKKLEKDFDKSTAKIAAGTTGLINTLTFGLLPPDLQEKIATTIATWITTISTSLDEFFGPGFSQSMKDQLAATFDIFSGLGDLLKAMWNGDSEGVNKALKKIGTAIIDALVSGVIFSLNAILKIGPKIMEYFFLVLEFISSKLGNVFLSLKNIPIFGPLFEMLGNLFKGIGDFFKFIKEIWKDVADFFKSTDITASLKAIPSVLSETWKDFKTWASNVWKTITKPFKDAWDYVKQAWDGMWQKINSLVEKVIQWGISMFDSITKPFKDAWDYVKQAWDGVWQTINSLVEKVIQWGISIFDSVTKPFKDAWDFVIQTWDGVWQTINSLVEKVIQWGISMFDSVTKPFKDAWTWLTESFGFTVFEKLGNDIIDGIMGPINGIIDAVKGPFNAAVDGIEGLLGISSPSKVFGEIGGSMSDGIVGGMSNMHTEVKSEVEKTSILFDETFKSLEENIMNTLKSIVDNIPKTFEIIITTIEEALPELISAFEDMRDDILDAFSNTKFIDPFSKKIGTLIDAEELLKLGPFKDPGFVEEFFSFHQDTEKIIATNIKNLFELAFNISGAAGGILPKKVIKTMDGLAMFFVDIIEPIDTIMLAQKIIVDALSVVGDDTIVETVYHNFSSMLKIFESITSHPALEGIKNNLQNVEMIQNVIGAGIVPTIRAVEDMITSAQKLEDALGQGLKIDLDARLSEFAGKFGKVGAKGAYTVKARDVVINVKFNVSMDAQTIEKIMINNASSVIRNRLNLLIDSVQDSDSAETAQKSLASNGKIPQNMGVLPGG